MNNSSTDGPNNYDDDIFPTDFYACDPRPIASYHVQFVFLFSSCISQQSQAALSFCRALL